LVLEDLPALGAEETYQTLFNYQSEDLINISIKPVIWGDDVPDDAGEL
jgi:hypothetical protein